MSMIQKYLERLGRIGVLQFEIAAEQNFHECLSVNLRCRNSDHGLYQFETQKPDCSISYPI